MRTKWAIVSTACILLMIPSIFSAEANGQENFQPVQVRVILERVYLDGEVSQEETMEMVYSLQEFWDKYKNWELVEMDGNKVVFRNHIDDISPLLKANGYFGITDEGMLTIFNGKPTESQIIQSFFQLDMDKLETKKHEELKQGIRVKNKEHYTKVLKIFKNYTLPEGKY